MLDAQTIATIKSTIPLIAKTGPALTAHFTTECSLAILS